MLWLKGVKILFVISGVFFAGVLIALANDEFGWAMVCGLLALLLGAIAQRRIRQLCEYEDSYKNVKLFCVNESPGVWSTHVGGCVEKPVAQLCRRMKDLVLRKSGPLTGMKLVLQSDDRLEVRRRSLDCFINKLYALEGVKGAVLLTASVLNDANRGTGRLQELIKAVEERPQWSYQLIERRLGVFDALVGRVFYGWTIPKEGGFWRYFYVPGLVAWRAQDRKPCSHELKVREVFVVDSRYQAKKVGSVAPGR